MSSKHEVSCFSQHVLPPSQLYYTSLNPKMLTEPRGKCCFLEHFQFRLNYLSIGFIQARFDTTFTSLLGLFNPHERSQTLNNSKTSRRSNRHSIHDWCNVALIKIVNPSHILGCNHSSFLCNHRNHGDSVSMCIWFSLSKRQAVENQHCLSQKWLKVIGLFQLLMTMEH